jgi:hypothetical protein
LCGDFNVTRLQNDVYDSLSHPRWTDHPSCTTTERDMFAELMAQSDLVDVQQKFNVHGFTFFRSRYLAAQNKGMRLDYFLCTEDFRRQNILRMELLNTTAGSDHVPSVLTLNTELFSREELGLEKPKFELNVPNNMSSLSLIVEAPSSFAIKGKHTMVSMFNIQQHFTQLLFLDDQQTGATDKPSTQYTPPKQCASSARTLDPLDSGSVKWQDMEELFNGRPNNRQYKEDNEDRHGIASSAAEKPGRVILPVLYIRINGVIGQDKALADSGASASIACYTELSKRLGKTTLDSQIVRDPNAPSFRTADGGITRPLGNITLDFHLNNVEFSWTF